MKMRLRHVGAICSAALVASLAVACGRAPPPGSKPALEEGKVLRLPRSLVVREESVVIEGRWYPSEAGPKSPAIPNAVRVLCVRAERSCKEDLTRLSADRWPEPVHDVLQYRVDEWTKAGKPAGKLIASRREGSTEVEIRVSLSGFAAEKVVIDTGGETRWRLE